jgi:hypothetical protein
MTRMGRSASRRLSVCPGLFRLMLLLASSTQSRASDDDAKIVLQESQRAGTATRTEIKLKANGLFRPGLPPGKTAAGARLPKPLSLEVQTRLVFHERLVRSVQVDAVQATSKDAPGTQTRPGSRDEPRLTAVRQIVQAASAINGEVRPSAAVIRPDVSLLFAQRRDRDGPVVVVSPGGPLTRAELELVQGLGDPLALLDLLPAQPVARGESWRVGDAAALAVSGYDTLTSNELNAQLESIDATQARIRLDGKIKGSALGGAGAITANGFLIFDRKTAMINRLELNRAEIRQPGPIEAGLDVKSTLVVIRQLASPPATITDSALAGIPIAITPQRELLQVVSPSGKASLEHDRQWHILWDDPKLTVLLRLENGQVVAQCNLAVGPTVAKGRHQDPNQFRDDVRRALKQRFGEILGAGEVEGDAAGGYRYKVAVEGHEGDLRVVWFYYLVASPAGDQLLATFTLAADHVAAFGGKDLQMIGSLRWTSASHVASPESSGGLGEIERNQRP